MRQYGVWPVRFNYSASFQAALVDMDEGSGFLLWPVEMAEYI